MKKENEFEAAARLLIEEGRRRVGPEPSVEELAAYQRGDLSPEAEERFRERLAHYPDAVRVLEALAVEDYAGAPGDPHYLSDEALERSWETLQGRLRWRPRLWPPTWLPADWVRIVAVPAAVAIVAGALGFLAGGVRTGELEREVAVLREPRVNPEILAISPDGERRGPAVERSFRLPPIEGAHHLSLTLYEAPSFPDYRLEIVPADEKAAEPIWARSGLAPEPGAVVRLVLPGGFLSPGRYEIRLFGIEGEERTLLATYTIEA